MNPGNNIIITSNNNNYYLISLLFSTAVYIMRLIDIKVGEKKKQASSFPLPIYDILYIIHIHSDLYQCQLQIRYRIRNKKYKPVIRKVS